VRNLISSFGFSFAVGPAQVACHVHSQEPPSKRRRIDDEVKTASTLPIQEPEQSKAISKSVEVVQSLEAEAERAGCETLNEVVIESKASSRTQPAKRGRKKKAAAIAVEIIVKQDEEADAPNTTSRARPKRRAAEDAAAKVIADLIEEELPIDKKRRDEVPREITRKRGAKVAANDARSGLMEGSAEGVTLEPTHAILTLVEDRDPDSSIASQMRSRGAGIKDIKPRGRDRKVADVKHGDSAMVVVARECVADSAPTRVPLAETDINNTVITTVINDEGKDTHPPKVARKPRGRPPSKPSAPFSAQKTALKPKRRVARLSIHNDLSDKENSSSRHEERVQEQFGQFVTAQHSNPELQRGESSQTEKERAAEGGTHNLKRGAEDLTTSETKEKRQICVSRINELSSNTETTRKVPKRKMQNHVATEIGDDNGAEPEEEKLETNKSTVKPLPSHAQSRISTSDTMTSTTCKVPREPAPVRKRGRPRKTPGSASAEIQASSSKPSTSKTGDTNTNQAPDSSKLSKYSAPPQAPTITHSQPRHHVDEDVDWLFAPAQTRLKPVVSKPSVTVADTQQRKRKINARDLPEMDLEELLSGITSLAEARQPQSRLMKRVKS
jgi:hypothetical protein